MALERLVEKLASLEAWQLNRPGIAGGSNS